MRPLSLFRVLLGLAMATASLTAQPLWWTTQEAVSGQADDYAVANLGQLKTLCTAATFEMNTRLSGGAGTGITSLVSAWWQPPGPGVTRDDFAALNQGQLKTVATLFYDKLGLAYPWTSTTADDDDYALINLGQLKSVFSFPILVSGVTDTDADGLPDAWETTHFGNLSQSAAGDPDGDGLNNLAEYHVGTNPGTGGTATLDSAGACALTIFSP